MLKAPFPYFGGKSSIAHLVWQRLGDVPNYVEPFAGSLAVLLARPDRHAWWGRIETVNDADGLLCNFWRAVQADPYRVARYADWPVNESDLHARHAWLVGQRESLQARLEGDPDYYDARAAGWWVWGICAWIGGGWCSGEGPWRVVNGMLVRVDGAAGTDTPGVSRQLPHLGDAGQGINRKLPAKAGLGPGICEMWAEELRQMMRRLQDRLRRVRVCCGDWCRVCGPAVTTRQGLTGVFLDPPYSHAERDTALYARDADVAGAVRAWAIQHGENLFFRIALCGYEGEHDMPEGWSVHRWRAHGGYAHLGEGRGKVNKDRECIWFSPYCLPASGQQLQLEVFD